ERLGLPMPPMADTAHPLPTDSQRAAFQARPITRAVREVARDADWQTTIKFFREIANQAQDESDFVLLGDYARTLGRRDLAVVAGQAAENAGYQNFRSLCFPLMPLPATADFTMVHAITRQESQFSQNALSRTGARGLMQLMPSTAEGVARHLGLAYSAGALTQDASFNTALGGAYFAHLLEVFSGSYPLAIAAYNAGPGAVRRWLGQYGDPRSTGADWVEWIEKLPYGETRGYVQHVIENAVVYEAMNPARASYRGPNPTSHFLGKGGPG
ncbi:MAG TPA: lytic transglycosylase domain-containing protein, partial [Novosphingobium sp.]|nr:lytic transglycosylase domain-containing protein [Novosphingobium sp.]